MATGAEVATLARECQQELVLAGVTAHAREPVLENSTVEKPPYHLAYDLAPVTPASRKTLIVYGAELVEMILDEAVQR